MTASTHELAIGEHEVVKTFRSWDRAEPDREWTALEILHRRAPGLAPVPLGRRELGGRPAVVMSRLPGEPLGGSPLTSRQVAAVAAAMSRLHSAVPPAELGSLPERLFGPPYAVRYLREAYDGLPQAQDGVVGTAVVEAARWLASHDAKALAAGGDEVFAQADGNLANYLWDGERCRLVDFEDSGVSDRAFEIADLVEHVSVWLPGLIDAETFVHLLDLDTATCARVRGMRRLFAVFWLHMLLPGNRGHHRNPPGTVDRQAERTLTLLS